MTEKKKRKTAGGLGYLLFLIIMVCLVLQFVGQRTTVHGISMEPSLSDGDQIWVDKLSYRRQEPERFDIVLFQKNGEDYCYIKRIIALPGERVRISYNGAIYINGELLKEYYGNEAIDNPGSAVMEIVLAEDEYFVLGDNRNKSEDSRGEEVGLVKASELVGRAVFRFYPLDAVGSLKNQ